MDPTVARRVAVLEPERLLREALNESLHRYQFEVRFAGSVEELHAALLHFPAAVALLDLASEPFDQRVEMCLKVASAHPDVRVVVLAGRSAELLDGYARAGAVAVLQRGQVSTGDVAVTLTRFSPPRQGQASAGDADVGRLSAREFEVFRHVAAGFDNLKIAAHLGITERTVRAHTAALYRKLAVDNRTQLALLARSLGVSPVSD